MISAHMIMAVLALTVAPGSSATDSREAVNAEHNKPVIRGGLVYKTYCMPCHGDTGNGVMRGSQLYGAFNLTIKPAAPARHEQIVRSGGKTLGKSAYMPAWQGTLSDEQITDVVEYLGTLGSAESRGQVVFKTNCILCHGVNGDGNGRAARMLTPPPANLTRSDKNDAYKEMIITLGGGAMGRSPRMPVWGEQLSRQEIIDVVAYLRTILVVPATWGF
jgi:cytochrome c oxidase cbb3-type subunit 3